MSVLKRLLKPALLAGGMMNGLAAHAQQTPDSTTPADTGKAPFELITDRLNPHRYKGGLNIVAADNKKILGRIKVLYQNKAARGRKNASDRKVRPCDVHALQLTHFAENGARITHSLQRMAGNTLVYTKAEQAQRPSTRRDVGTIDPAPETPPACYDVKNAVELWNLAARAVFDHAADGNSYLARQKSPFVRNTKMAEPYGRKPLVEKKDRHAETVRRQP